MQMNADAILMELIKKPRLISSDADGAIQRAGRFRVENGSTDENAAALPGTWRRTDVHLENPEYHTRWYFKYFLGQVHQNYIGNDAEKSPFFLSVTLSDQNNQRVPQYRAILWRKTVRGKLVFLKSVGLAVFPCVWPKLWSLLASGPQLYSLPQASPLQAVALGPYLFSCQAYKLAAPTLHLVSTGAKWALAPVRDCGQHPEGDKAKEDAETPEDEVREIFRMEIRRGTQKICLPYSPTKTLSVKSILSAMNLDKFEKGPREIFHPEIQKGSVNFKFGVLFAKDGQLTDDEMLSNEIGSEAFQKFLNLLGDTITLKGWTGYRGGLDTKNNTTGTVHCTLLLYNPDCVLVFYR
ncbi:GTPase-activating Rap/Ran-GAP domain-like protein 3 [Microtus ochrogaster]|uniref:GTPase-activating Rap/Ran-GAP domain-like protein 3 n=1 Tax=Microtus ochrogaster TaxID=79684 RepID=A0A8J6GTQ4_MICOH|nr:GTPase-activating Rap/Ran-GAP domain-like protein 3 [Microtus ochrogaster]